MIRIRPGCDDDKPQILELLREVYGPDEADRAERRWHWQWSEDPRLEAPGYKGVVADWNGQLIGSVSLIPAALRVEGRPTPANWQTDMVVHWTRLRRALKEHKREGKDQSIEFPIGIAGALLDYVDPKIIRLGKHVTDAMAPTWERMGFRELRTTGSWARLVSFKQPLQTRLGNFLGGLLGALADLALPRIGKPELKVDEWLGDFDSRFDELWSKASPEYQAITLRDASTLNWRYRRHPDIRYKVLIVQDNDDLKGYLVYSVFNRHQQQRAQIVDVFTHKGNTRVSGALIAAALLAMRKERVHKVECFASGRFLIDTLESMGFKPRLHNGKPHYALALGAPDVDYYFTRGDGDGA